MEIFQIGWTVVGNIWTYSCVYSTLQEILIGNRNVFTKAELFPILGPLIIILNSKATAKILFLKSKSGHSLRGEQRF